MNFDSFHILLPIVEIPGSGNHEILGGSGTIIAALLVLHVRIGYIAQGDKGLLNRLRGRPSETVVQTAGLVIRSFGRN